MLSNNKMSWIQFSLGEVLKKIKEYLLDEIKQIKDNGEITVETSLRRLALIYD